MTSTDRVLPRGTIKSFREYLNAKFSDSAKHRNNAYRQKTRPYGDYLYYQDRDLFNFELDAALDGDDHKDWKRP